MHLLYNRGDCNSQQTVILCKSIINVIYRGGHVTEELLPQIALPIRTHPRPDLNLLLRSFDGINLEHSEGLNITGRDKYHIGIDLWNRDLDNSSLFEGHRQMDIIVGGNRSLVRESFQFLVESLPSVERIDGLISLNGTLAQQSTSNPMSFR